MRRDGADTLLIGCYTTVREEAPPRGQTGAAPALENPRGLKPAARSWRGIARGHLARNRARSSIPESHAVVYPGIARGHSGPIHLTVSFNLKLSSTSTTGCFPMKIGAPCRVRSLSTGGGNTHTVRSVSL